MTSYPSSLSTSYSGGNGGGGNLGILGLAAASAATVYYTHYSNAELKKEIEELKKALTESLQTSKHAEISSKRCMSSFESLTSSLKTSPENSYQLINEMNTELTKMKETFEKVCNKLEDRVKNIEKILNNPSLKQQQRINDFIISTQGKQIPLPNEKEEDKITV